MLTNWVKQLTWMIQHCQNLQGITQDLTYVVFSFNQDPVTFYPLNFRRIVFLGGHLHIGLRPQFKESYLEQDLVGISLYIGYRVETVILLWKEQNICLCLPSWKPHSQSDLNSHCALISVNPNLMSQMWKLSEGEIKWTKMTLEQVA